MDSRIGEKRLMQKVRDGASQESCRTSSRRSSWDERIRLRDSTGQEGRGKLAFWVGRVGLQRAGDDGRMNGSMDRCRGRTGNAQAKKREGK